ncbi:general substrate transporter [Talaromyces proteolyticus]|uniref:General substrate transporter n=1 Tax=Talaromyces proteolyticus TaxID=1131652 RepID=A0AAD4PWJ4_9EURO|nr:general substrate transporter [Talaromyces proteolyticus]KAH8697935.1 general substrate transporter [Talaromyces proteolyticus]
MKPTKPTHLEDASFVLASNLNLQLGRLGATSTMIIFSIWMSLSAWLSLFDFSYGGIVLVMDPFKKSFGHCQSRESLNDVCELSAIQQSLVGVTSIFMALGGGFGGLVATYIGRRGTVQIGCLITAIGAAGMLGTSGSYLNYMVCKCIGGIGIGLIYSSAPVYGAECVFPKQRGSLLALFNIGQALGSLTAAAVCAGTAHLQSDWSWKIPISCQIPLGLFIAVSLFYFPESPRWLLLNKKSDLARDSLSRFYHMEANCDMINHQLQTIQNYIELERNSHNSVHPFDIFRSGNTRRTLISSLVLIGLAITGIAFITPYATLFLGNVGVKNPYLVNVYIGLCTFAGALAGPIAIENLGRRVTLMAGYTGMGLCMLILAAVNSGLGEGSKTAQKVLVAFVCIWSFIFGSSVGPASWVSSPEIHSVQLRTYGQAFSTVMYQIFSFAASFWSPYMINADYGNMGTSVGYYYFGVSAGVLVLIFLCMPETSLLTLEQIDDYFLSGDAAWKTSLRKNKLLSTEPQPGDVKAMH